MLRCCCQSALVFVMICMASFVFQKYTLFFFCFFYCFFLFLLFWICLFLLLFFWHIGLTLCDFEYYMSPCDERQYLLLCFFVLLVFILLFEAFLALLICNYKTLVFSIFEFLRKYANYIIRQVWFILASSGSYYVTDSNAIRNFITKSVQKLFFQM